jgi:hypothetical protein
MFFADPCRGPAADLGRGRARSQKREQEIVHIRTQEHASPTLTDSAEQQFSLFIVPVVRISRSSRIGLNSGNGKHRTSTDPMLNVDTNVKRGYESVNQYSRMRGTSVDPKPHRDERHDDRGRPGKLRQPGQVNSETACKAPAPQHRRRKERRSTGPPLLLQIA